MAYLSFEIGFGKQCEKSSSDYQPSKTKGKTASGNLNSQQSRFKKAVEKCHCRTKKSQTFGQCMSKELKK